MYLPLIMMRERRMHEQVGQQLATELGHDGGAARRVHAALHQRRRRRHVHVLAALVVHAQQRQQAQQAVQTLTTWTYKYHVLLETNKNKIT